MSRKVALHRHSPIRLHGVALSLETGTTSLMNQFGWVAVVVQLEDKETADIPP
jgi:hypothetical protein